MGEFWWKHANLGVASRAGLVALSIGVDVLYSDYPVPIFIFFNEFDFAWVFAAEAVVERGGGGNGGGFVLDDADAAAVTDEDFFKF